MSRVTFSFETFCILLQNFVLKTEIDLQTLQPTENIHGDNGIEYFFKQQ